MCDFFRCLRVNFASIWVNFLDEFLKREDFKKSQKKGKRKNIEKQQEKNFREKRGKGNKQFHSGAVPNWYAFYKLLIFRCLGTDFVLCLPQLLFNWEQSRAVSGDCALISPGNRRMFTASCRCTALASCIIQRQSIV